MTITQEEAKQLIDMIKKYIGNQGMEFPNTKGKLEFEVQGEKRGNNFVVNIERKGPDAKKFSYQGRSKNKNVILMRIDINETGVHQNPSGEKIKGSHIHLYTEGYDTRIAIPINWDHKDPFDACFEFFEKFHIVEPPKFVYKPNLDL